MSIGSGGGGTTGAIRSQSDSAAPIWKSAPSGPAISSATNALSVLPVVMRGPPRRPGGPGSARGSRTPCPAPTTVPARRAGRSTRSQSYMSSTTNGWSQPATPEVCAEHVPDLDGVLAVGRELRPVLRHRRVRVELAAVDEHQRGEVRHGLRRRPHVGDRVLGPRRAARRSRQPPQTSTTVSPSMSTTMLAPSSSPVASCCSSASRTGAKRASHVPDTAPMVVIMGTVSRAACRGSAPVARRGDRGRGRGRRRRRCTATRSGGRARASPRRGRTRASGR